MKREGSPHPSAPAVSLEAALRLSEATRAAIVGTAFDCVITLDHHGCVVDWNPVAENAFGCAYDEVVGKELGKWIRLPGAQTTFRAWLAQMTDGRQMDGRRWEIQAIRKNGEAFPAELAVTRISGGGHPLFAAVIRDLSPRKEAELALRESQRLLSSITGNLNEGIFRRSLSEGLLFVNESYLRMFGYGSMAELHDVPPEKFYGTPERRAEIVKRLESDGVVHNEEIEYCRKDGSRFWGLTSATGIRHEQTGKLLYFDGAIHDITGRRQAAVRQAVQYQVARALAESADLRSASLRMLQAVCESLGWDLGGLWWVEEGEKPLCCVEIWARPGLPLKEFAAATRGARFEKGVGLPGRIWQSGQAAWIADVQADRNFPRLAIAAKCGLRGAFGVPITLGNQTLGVIEFFSCQAREPDEDLLALFAALGSQVGQFIERKHGEEQIRALNRNLEKRVAERTNELSAANVALRESESRFRTVTQHTPTAIVVLDTETGKFIEVNETALKLFGLGREKLLSIGPVEVSPEIQPDGQPSPKSARAKIQRALTGSFEIFEWTHLHSSGMPIACEIRLTQLPGAGRKLVVGVILDITTHKKAEAELLRALEQEKELNQLKTNFVNMVSHEFRTPLGVIVSSADILKSYFDRLQPPQRAGHLEDIAFAASQMTRLMEEVLLLGRVEAGRAECKPEPADLAAFCQRLVDEQLSASNRKCVIHFETKLPDTNALCDEGLLRHIFGNLIDNAVKYSAAGSVVSFSLAREGDEAVFRVRDEGIGIPAEDQKRLYEAFHRAKNVGEIPGTGLGLTIVKRCVDLHGGNIAVTSQAGRGTTFAVRLKVFTAAPAMTGAKRKPVNRKKR